MGNWNRIAAVQAWAFGHTNFNLYFMDECGLQVIVNQKGFSRIPENTLVADRVYSLAWCKTGVARNGAFRNTLLICKYCTCRYTEFIIHVIQTNTFKAIQICSNPAN